MKETVALQNGEWTAEAEQRVQDLLMRGVDVSDIVGVLPGGQPLGGWAAIAFLCKKNGVRARLREKGQSELIMG